MCPGARSNRAPITSATAASSTVGRSTQQGGVQVALQRENVAQAARLPHRAACASPRRGPRCPARAISSMRCPEPTAKWITGKRRRSLSAGRSDRLHARQGYARTRVPRAYGSRRRSVNPPTSRTAALRSHPPRPGLQGRHCVRSATHSSSSRQVSGSERMRVRAEMLAGWTALHQVGGERERGTGEADERGFSQLRSR